MIRFNCLRLTKKQLQYLFVQIHRYEKKGKIPINDKEIKNLKLTLGIAIKLNLINSIRIDEEADKQIYAIFFCYLIKSKMTLNSTLREMLNNQIFLFFSSP